MKGYTMNMELKDVTLLRYQFSPNLSIDSRQSQ